MNIVIAGNFTMPSGMAASARIKNLAMGMAHNKGVSVSIIAFKQKYYQAEELSLFQTFERHGIKINFAIEHPEKLRKIDKPFLNRTAANSMINHLEAKRKVQKVDALFLYGVRWMLLYPLVRYAKQHGIFTILDVVENRLKMARFKNYLTDPFQYDVSLGAALLPKKVDMIAAITSVIESEYKGKKPVYLLPGIEAWNKDLENSKAPQYECFNLLYVGSLIQRDDPQQLFDLVQLLIAEKTKFKLILVGKYQSHEYGKNWSEQFKSQFPNYIELAGEVTEKEMAELKKSANGFVLTRKNDEPERYAFPTRLVEYLKEAKMVLVSKVGDIPIYLDHMHSACLIEKERLPNIASEISVLMNNPALSYEMGVKGYRAGEKLLNRSTHAENLIKAMIAAMNKKAMLIS